MVLVDAGSDQERYPGGTPVGTFSQSAAAERGITGIADFWAVWCPQERVFVESIWYLQFDAQNDANMHNVAHDSEHGFFPPHRAFPYQVTFQESRSGTSYEDYGPPRPGPTGLSPRTALDESVAGPYQPPPSLAEREQRERAKARAHMSAAPAKDAHADVPPTPAPEVARRAGEER
jgi:hypothetical protein